MITRSRKGCLSCKKLKIKCNEAKPVCEYCESTGRQCQYPGFAINQKKFEATPKKGPRRKKYDGTLVAGMKLNSTTKLLQINLLELLLLKVFHEQCTPFFSFFGADKDIEYAWAYSVPTIFSQSLLVRNAIYLFAALTLWPMYNIDESLSLDKISKLLRFDQEVLLGANGIGSGIKNKDKRTITPDSLTRTSLFEITTEYFISTLRENQQVVAQHCQGPPGQIKNFGCMKKTAELAVASILIITYMGFHPEGMLPLVVFHDDTQVDFVSLSRNTKQIMFSASTTLRNTEFGGLFARYLKYKEMKVLKTRYHMIEMLFSKLDEYFYNISHTLEIDLASELDYNVLKASIDVMNRSLYQMEMNNFPNGIYSWILLIQDQYYSLVKKQHPFATKLLFVYACLNLIFDFTMAKSKSCFTKFALWYKDHMLLDEFDRELYRVAIEQHHHYTDDNFSTIRNFNPIPVSDDIDNFSNPAFNEWL